MKWKRYHQIKVCKKPLCEGANPQDKNAYTPMCEILATYMKSRGHLK